MTEDSLVRCDSLLKELFPLIYRQIHKERVYDFSNETDRKDYNRRVKELVCL